MSRINCIILIQLLMEYYNYTTGGRVFKFTKNNRMRIHRETPEEIKSRKSIIDDRTVSIASEVIESILRKNLKGRAGKVFIDPQMKNIAVPLSMSASETGFGILPTGSRVKIPEGKKVRAFTYWEQVNDIDLSCFGLTEDGQKEEFSWRTMWDKQSNDITFSGDETSGYHGGSEYFDIDLKKFKEKHPEFRYIVFCDNVYSECNFDECFCKAGFMLRDNKDSGEVYEPKTVDTSYKITGDARFSYMFAIDLRANEMVWLNINRSDRMAVAGEEKMDFLMQYLNAVNVFNVYDLFVWAGEQQHNIFTADIIVSDNCTEEDILKDKEIIHSYDFEKILKYIQ